MPQDWIFRVEACFTDARPVLDVKYDLEKRVNRLLTRDAERAGVLAFRGHQQSYTFPGGTTIELRLEAAYDSKNLYVLHLDADGPGDLALEKTWEENLRRALARWTSGLEIAENRAPSSPDRYAQVVAQTMAQERELASHPPDDDAIRAVQETILEGLRHGSSFFTAHHEGGTTIRFWGTSFVFQDYGESNDREEFSSSEAFLARLRQFYDWESRRDWSPHAPPELEAWRYIERQMKKP